MYGERIILGNCNGEEISVNLDDKPHISILASKDYSTKKLIENLTEEVLKSDENSKVYILNYSNFEYKNKESDTEKRIETVNDYSDFLKEIREEVFKRERYYRKRDSLSRILLVIGDDTENAKVVSILKYILRLGRYPKISIIMNIINENLLDILKGYETQIGIRLEGKLNNKNNELESGEFYLNSNKTMKLTIKNKRK